MRSCIVTGLPTHLVQELNVVTVQSSLMMFLVKRLEELGFTLYVMMLRIMIHGIKFMQYTDLQDEH